MGKLNTTTAKPLHACESGNAAVYFDSLAVTNADIDAADEIRPIKVPGGLVVHRVVIKTTEIDTHGSPTLTAKIGFTPTDGSAAASGQDTLVAEDGAFAQSAATTTYEIFPPVEVPVESYLNIVIGTGAATEAATGTIYAKVEGEPLGVK